MMSVRMGIAVSLVSALAMPSGGCIIITGGSGCQGPAVWTESVTERVDIDAPDLKGVTARTHNGTIKFRPLGPENGRPYVEVTKKAGGWSPADAQKALEAVEAYARVTPDKTLEVGWQWKEPKSASWRATVSFNIYAPREVNLKARTHNGALDIEDVEGDVELRAHNGSINVRSGGGKLYARTHNGRIEAAHQGTEIALRTHNGRVKVSLAGSHVVDGKISTHNGAVEVVLDNGVSTNITGRTHNGQIRFEGPAASSTLSRRQLNATLGDGTGKLAVTTHNGGIRIRTAGT